MEYSPIEFNPVSDNIDNIDNMTNMTNINEWNEWNHTQMNEPVNVKKKHCEKSIVIKDLLEECLHKKESINIDNEEYKNEEIDSIVNQIESFADKFSILQVELEILHKEYVKENNITKTNVDKIDSSVKYMMNMESKYEIDENLKEIFDKMNDYSQKVKENDKLIDAKSKYIEKRKELNSYLYFIQKINKWNTSAICPICITDSIDSYCNPCGHTACRKCLDRTKEISGHKCPICREYIVEIRKLFFL